MKITFKRIWAYGGDRREDDADYVCGYQASNGAMIEKKFADGLNVYCWKIGEDYYDTLSAAKDAVIRKSNEPASTPEATPAETDTASETVSEPETETNATVKAAIARLTRRVKRETGDNIRDCFEAIAEEHDAASEATAAMEKEADDYINAVTARFCANGTEVEPETADEADADNKAAAMTAQEITARKMIAEQSTEYILETWESTTANNDPFIPTVRGWLMDELQSRYPEAYGKWLDSEVCEDAALREYVNAEYDADGRFVGVTEPKAGMKFDELPVSVQNDVKERLCAYDACAVLYEYGKYRVSAGTCIKASYAPDFTVCGRYAAEDIFTPEERVLNYANSFYSYPPEYYGERDYHMMRVAQERGAKLEYDNAGNIRVASEKPATDSAEPETVELHDDIDTYAVCEKNGITWTRVNADTLAISINDYQKLLDGAKNKRYIRNLRRDSNTGRFCGGAFTLAGTIAG